MYCLCDYRCILVYMSLHVCVCSQARRGYLVFISIPPCLYLLRKSLFLNSRITFFLARQEDSKLNFWAPTILCPGVISVCKKTSLLLGCWDPNNFPANTLNYWDSSADPSANQWADSTVIFLSHSSLQDRAWRACFLNSSHTIRVLHLFFKEWLYFLLCICVYACMGTWALEYRYLRKPEASDPPRTGAIGACEPPETGNKHRSLARVSTATPLLQLQCCSWFFTYTW